MNVEEWVYDPISNLSCDLVTSDRCQKPRVLVVIVHGGAWMLGSKDTFRGMSRHICHEFGGVTCVVPNYTLSRIELSCILRSKILLFLILFQITCLFVLKQKHGRGPTTTVLLFLFFVIIIAFVVEIFQLEKSVAQQNAHPRHVRDVASCIEKTCARIFPGQDPIRIVLIGHSAGAHLCSLLALNSQFLHPMLFQSIVGTVVISGIYSFWEMQRSVARHLLNKNIFIGMFDEQWTPETLDQIKNENQKQYIYITSAWPMFHVQKESRKLPFLILTSDTDFSILKHSVVFENELKTCGFSSNHIHFKNTTHFSIHKHWNSKHKHIFQCVHNFLTQVCP